MIMWPGCDNSSILLQMLNAQSMDDAVDLIDHFNTQTCLCFHVISSHRFVELVEPGSRLLIDRKSTRLNSSHWE